MSFELSNLFRRSTTPPAIVAPGNAIPGSGVVPPAAQPTEAETTPVSPLESFKTVWDTPNTPVADTSLFGNLDPSKLMESARQVDFTKVIKPEQLAAISQGGEGAVKAFAEALNGVAQTVYGQSALATTKIVEQALSKNSEVYDKKMQDMVKKFSVGEGLQASNPLLNNPAVAPIIGALTEQLTRKNPSATSTEIQSQVLDYMKQLGTAFAPAPVESKSASGRSARTENWDSFLN